MPKRILIADDEKEIAQRRAELLKERGYEVELAFDGKKALKLLKEKVFDLLILDLDMPRLRGDEVLEKIKDDERFSSLRVLVITGLYEPPPKTLDEWGYTHHPISRAKELGLLRRGWEARFNLIKKWEKMDFFSFALYQEAQAKGLKPLPPPDQLSERRFLEAVEEMFLEPKPIDRPHKENEPYRILIVDDDSKIRESIRKRLEKNSSYRIREAQNGEEALNILSKDPIDLVILDLEMPKTKGDEVLSVLNTLPVLRNIPIIIYTQVKDWDKPEDVSLRKKIEKIKLAKSVYEKEKSHFKRILRLDSASLLLDKVEELLKERKDLGFGYLKQPITLIKNKEKRFMRGALEYYEPVNPSKYEHLNSYLCEYCFQEKEISQDFHLAYEYDPNEIVLLPQGNLTYLEQSLICPSCSRELKEKYPQLGSYALKIKEERERIAKERERIKEKVKKSPKREIDRKIFKKVVEIIKDKNPFYKDEIKPETLFKDVFSESQVWHRYREEVFIDVELEYDIDIPLQVRDWFDTVGDLVSFVEEKIKEKPPNQETP